jgi:ribosomal RNA-processing protein 17
VEDHVQAVTKLLQEAQEAGQDDIPSGGSEDEWQGIPDKIPEEPPLDREDEYIDEDRFTTVTIEAVNIDREGLHKAKPEGDGSDDDQEEDDSLAANDEARQGKSATDRPKKKKRKFRYETKFERKLTAKKQRAKKSKR